ncbi:hypothetical protein [Spiroplasma poulsonii]|uniref:hypothetical protein n=1 Tax=Spiroplasma poulsonii TaxID=2138 RepID=UPI001F4C5C5C|nr:hypothetical protein [Spiroplasma poulsonii]UNF61247.1 hypothetical protein MNU24_04850 [Spiroplasma poulsonii]
MIILMINYYYWDATGNPIQRPKKTKTILFLVKEKHTIKNTSNYRTRNQKNYCKQVFAWKNMIMLLFKESKSHL